MSSIPQFWPYFRRLKASWAARGAARHCTGSAALRWALSATLKSSDATLKGSEGRCGSSLGQPLDQGALLGELVLEGGELTGEAGIDYQRGLWATQ